MKKNLLKPLLSSLLAASLLVGCNSGTSPKVNQMPQSSVHSMQKNQVGHKAEDMGLSYILDDQQLKALGGSTEAKNILFVIKNPATNKWELAANQGSAVMDPHPMPAYFTIKAFINWEYWAPLAAKYGTLEVEIRNAKTGGRLGYNMQVFGSDNYELNEKVPVGTKLLPGDQWVFLDDEPTPNTHILMLNKNDHAPMYLGMQYIMNNKEYQDGWGLYAETLEKEHYDLDDVIVAKDGLHADIQGQNVNLSKAGIQYPNGYSNISCRSAEDAFDKLLNPPPKVLYLEQHAGDHTGEIAIYDITNQKLLNTNIVATNEITAADADDLYAPAFTDGKVPDPDLVSLIPHRQYNINFTFRCKEGEIDVLCGDLLNKAIADSQAHSEILTLAGTPFKEQLSLNEISTPLKNALINNKSIESDGNVNLIQNASILEPKTHPNTATIRYRPYFAQSNQNYIRLTLQFPGEPKPWVGTKFLRPVSKVYNYKFETETLSLRNIDNVFNVSDEGAGIKFNLYEFSKAPKYTSESNYFDLSKLENKEGRYGFTATSNYNKAGAGRIGYETFKINHDTNLPVPIVLYPRVDRSFQVPGNYLDLECSGYAVAVSSGGNKISMNLSSDGSTNKAGEEFEISSTCKELGISGYYNISIHTEASCNRDDNGAGASISIYEYNRPHSGC